MVKLLGRVRAEERRVTRAAFASLFGILVSHALLETARDALFLAKIPAHRLAWVYLGIAAVALVVFSLQERQAQGQEHRTRLSRLLLSAAVVTALFWLLAGRSGNWALYAVYIWSGVFATLVVVRFWTLAAGLFTVVQAKRLYAPIGVGAVLGATLGSGLAGLLTNWLAPRSLLLLASGVMVLTAYGPVRWIPAVEDESGSPARGTVRAERGLRQSWRATWQSPYLRRVATIVLLSTVTFTLVDFLFKTAVAQEVAPDRLGTFFGGTYFVINLLSFLAQLFLVDWLVRTLGISRVLSLLPSLLMMGALGVLLGGGLVAAMIIKGLDGTLRHSVHRTTTEVLWVPLTGDLRTRVKGLIDVLGQRGGQAIASLCFLAIGALGSVQLVLGGLILALAAVWVRLAITIQRHYLDLFRKNLSELTIAARLEFPDLDMASLETLLATLNSPDDSEVASALELLGEQDRTHLIPGLILHHPSSRVVVRALDLFAGAGRRDCVPLAEHLLQRPETEVRTATLRALEMLAPDPARARRFLHDPAPIVRATALVGLAATGDPTSAEIRNAVAKLAEEGSEEQKLALAAAIRGRAQLFLEETLLTLARSGDHAVRQEVARSMAARPSPRFVPALLEMLPERRLRGAAQIALANLGQQGLENLEAALDNEKLDPRIRRQVPRALSRFPAEEAAAILVRRLPAEGDGSVRDRIVRGLLLLRREHPDLPLSEEVLKEGVEKTLSEIFLYVNWTVLLEKGRHEDASRATVVQEMIVDLFQHRQGRLLERLFQLLFLLFPAEDLRRIYRGTRSADKRIRASGLELLEHVLRPPLRDPVLAAVDQIGGEEKLARVGGYHRRITVDYDVLLQQFLEVPDVGLRCLAAYHVGELGLHGLRPSLETLSSDASVTLRSVVGGSLSLLSRSQHGEDADGG